jgi:hypothetical protein
VFAQVGELEAAFESKTTIEWISADAQTRPATRLRGENCGRLDERPLPGRTIVIIDDTKSPRANDFVLALLPKTPSRHPATVGRGRGPKLPRPLNRSHQAVEVTDCRLLGVVVQATLFF